MHGYPNLTIFYSDFIRKDHDCNMWVCVILGPNMAKTSMSHTKSCNTRLILGILPKFSIVDLYMGRALLLSTCIEKSHRNSNWNESKTSGRVLDFSLSLANDDTTLGRLLLYFGAVVVVFSGAV